MTGPMIFSRLEAGTTIAGRYLVQQQIGRGRSAAVYRGVDVRTGGPVALKVLDPFVARDPVALARFEREVAILRTVDHPNVVKVYDVVREDDLCVICMELVDGVDASRLLARSGRLPVVELLAIVRQVVAAVGACHRVGVLHRDLKPQNLMVGRASTVKLVDFGVARVSAPSDLTRTGTVIGSAPYMAPEQFLSAAADQRSDIYAIGVICYELLTARLPRGGVEGLLVVPTPIEEIRADVPPWLAAVVAKCLAAAPERRYQSCVELRADLELGRYAQAARAAAVPASACLGCGAEMAAELPFCHRCGAFRTAQYAPGPVSLVLDQCDDVRALRDSLCRLVPGADAAALERALGEPPVVVLGGVSRAAAGALLAECLHVPGELRIVERLAGAFRVPPWYLLAVPIVLVTIGMLPTMTGRLGLTALTAAVLVVMYRTRTRPVIRLADLPRGAEATPELLQVAAACRDLGDPRLQAMLGTVAREALRVERLAGGSPAPLLPTRAWALVGRAIEAARTLRRYETYLEGTTLGELHARLEATELQLAAAPPGAAAALVDRRSTLRRALADHRAIEDAHAELACALLNLGGVLRELADARGAQARPDLAATDLDRLEALLAAPAPASAA